MNRPPEPNASDLVAWRRLIKHASRCGADPAAYVGDLSTVLPAARRAVMPPPASKDSPFTLLFRLAQRFVQAKPGQRREMATELRMLAERCDVILGERNSTLAPSSSPIPPPRRERADIDG